MTITHTFVSAIADGADTTVVRPLNWNATHTESGGNQPTLDYVLLANSYTALVGDVPLIPTSGYRVDLPSGAILDLLPDLGADGFLENNDLNQDLVIASHRQGIVIGPYLIESNNMLYLADSGGSAVFSIIP